MAPTPDDPCSHLVGAAGDACGSGGGSSPSADPTVALDPLAAFAHSCGKAAAWVVERLAESIDGAATIDFTNSGFLAQYAVVFAASVFLTMTLWLIAVAKRALRGAPLTTAFGEAIGFLWFAVLASAFTPLVLYVLVGAVDAVTDTVAGALGAGGSRGELFKSLATTLRQGGDSIGGGPVVHIIVSGVTIIAAGLLWLVLVLRSVALYAGGIFGPLVYSGVVDRALWPKVRRWAGLMIAVILIEPIIAIALGISSVFTAERGPGATPIVAAGLAVIIIALASSVAIFKFVPGYGDDIASGLAMRAAMTSGRAGKTVAMSAAGVVARGMQTHAERPPRVNGQQSSKGKSNVSDGIQAHGSRAKKDKPEK